jgi:hypothetical protein
MSRSTITGFLGALAFALASDVAAQPSTNINDYVLFASRMIKTKGPTISDGDVGVNLQGGRLIAPRFFFAPNSVVASDRVRFDKNPSNTVLETLYANVIEHYGPPNAIPFTPPIIADVKAACGFPIPFPNCQPASPVDVAVGTTTNLPPGVYGKVRVHGTALSSGNLVLTGGNYVFCDLKVGRNADLRVQTASTIDVAGSVSFGPDTFFGPDTGSGLVASDIQLYSAGPVVKLTRDSFSKARICAPDSKMRLTQGGTHNGVYVADFIRTEGVFLDVGSPSGAFLQ